MDDLTNLELMMGGDTPNHPPLPTSEPSPDVGSDPIETALRVYDIIHFREWDYSAALERYRRHESTQRAVKEIAQLVSQNGQGHLRREQPTITRRS